VNERERKKEKKGERKKGVRVRNKRAVNNSVSMYFQLLIHFFAEFVKGDKKKVL